MRQLVGITKDTTAKNVNKHVKDIAGDLPVRVRIARARIGQPWLIEVEAKDLETINVIRQRAIDKWAL